MKQFPSGKQESDSSHPKFGICPRCKEEQFLSVPTLEFGLICIYCLYEMYPPNGLPRPIDKTTSTPQERNAS